MVNTIAVRNWIAGVAATAAAVNALCMPVAGADDTTTHTLGSAAELTNGEVVQAWTISGLQPSTDVIPYPVVGTLWEATATDVAVRGIVQPIVSNLNARSSVSGESYRVLFGVATAQGVNPAPLAQGQETTGKIYFDVPAGDAPPDSVYYSAGGPALAQWVQPPPPPATASPGSGSVGYTPASPSVASPAVAPAGEAPTPAAPAPTPAAAPAGEGSQGTPIDADAPVQGSSQGTPIDESSHGTPVAPTEVPATPGTPAPAAENPAPGPTAVDQAPTAAGSSGTPVTHGSEEPTEATMSPATTTPVAPPA